MLSEIDIQHILFLDIETVPQEQSFDQLSGKMQQLWEKKSSYFRSEGEVASDVYQRAGIYAEFGRIICISVGIITPTDNGRALRLKSYAGDDEQVLLNSFAAMLRAYSGNKPLYLCAHNGKEFDFPFIARRMIIKGIKLPTLLDNAGKKPWEVQHLDTMELWKFGDYKHYTSLDLLTAVFDIPSPKDDMDGSMVAKVYYEEHDMKRIISYCQNDVIAVAQLLLKFKGMELISKENIGFSED
jgi:3'-5' exonuclease